MQNFAHTCVLLAALAAAMPLAAGCGGASTGVKTFPVTGVVTMGGEPVDGAIVQFTPTATDAGTAGAQARTDAAGRFEMSMLLDNGRRSVPGLPAGDYRVSVVKYETPAGGTAILERPRNLLPAKYESPDGSGLSATVKSGSENNFQFEL
jgi:hypothetical protein